MSSRSKINDSKHRNRLNIMHEFWVCRNILSIIKEHALKENCSKVKLIYLEVGDLIMIDKSALLFSFDIMAKGTIAQGAILNFIDIPGRAWCNTCQTNIPLKRYDEACAVCGGFSRDIKAGEELRIKSMEVA